MAEANRRYQIHVTNPVDGNVDCLSYEDRHVACMVFANYVALNYRVGLFDACMDKYLASTDVAGQ